VTDVIEGEAVEVTTERAVAVAYPRGLARPETPTAMIELASQMATALAAIVEKQRLYATINGRKFPQVEAWMTIGRMDNVVAREAEAPIRHEDASYEAFVELVRLSDGMVVGRASALCGTPDDKPWNNRSEPARRSMAVTRATSRAFRQQYSWIMALAGYEPTPAEEMPRDEQQHDPGGLIGIAERGKPGSGAEFDLRIEATRGYVIGFRLTQGRKGYKVLAFGPLAEKLSTADVLGKQVQVWGDFHSETFTDKKTQREVTYQLVHAARIQTPDGTLDGSPIDEPAPDTTNTEPAEASSEPLFSPEEDAVIDAAVRGAA
jgi:hypothetical protein